MLLWRPSEKDIRQANLTAYVQWLKQYYALSFEGYQPLWEWSVNHTSAFWESIWKYFDILHDGKFQRAHSDDAMPHVKWFEGVRLNYAEHIFRKANDEYPAILFKSESGQQSEISWKELRQR